MASRYPVIARLAALSAVPAIALGGVAACSSGPPAIDAQCTAGAYDVDTGQASVAAQMVGEVYRSRIAHPDRAAVLVIAAALQESKLRNLAPGDGDRDSVGVLQQRPSQDWGKFAGEPSTNPARDEARAKRISDVTEATKEFLDKLVNFSKWWTLPAATAIQNVQISADGSLYAQHEDAATALGGALLGSTPAGFNCTFAAPTQVATTATVVAQLDHQLGLSTPTATAQAIRVPGAGWQTASWFVANADRDGIASVEYAKHTWTRTGGWKPSAATSTSVLATMAQIK